MAGFPAVPGAARPGAIQPGESAPSPPSPPVSATVALPVYPRPANRSVTVAFSAGRSGSAHS